MNALEIIWNQKLMQEDEEMDRHNAELEAMQAEIDRLNRVVLFLRGELDYCKNGFRELSLNDHFTGIQKASLKARVKSIDHTFAVVDDLGPLRGEV